MAILKVLEISSSSAISWEDASVNAVKEASKSLIGISSVYVEDQSALVVNGKITEYRINVKITFEDRK